MTNPETNKKHTDMVVDCTKLIRDGLSDAYLSVESAFTDVKLAAKGIQKHIQSVLKKKYPKVKWVVTATVDERYQATAVATLGKTVITMRATRGLPTPT